MILTTTEFKEYLYKFIPTITEIVYSSCNQDSGSDNVAVFCEIYKYCFFAHNDVMCFKHKKSDKNVSLTFYNIKHITDIEKNWLSGFTFSIVCKHFGHEHKFTFWARSKT